MSNNTKNMNRFFLFLAVSTVTSLSSLTAQITAKSPLASANNAELSVLAVNDLSIYSDEDNHTYFVDLEQVAVNVNKIVVKAEDGRVVWQDDVFDLPVNAIYELDFSGYTTGEYVIELQAFTGVIRKRIAHKRA
jgi:hypothetical protein